MSKEDKLFFWTLYGVFIAFAVQVGYDWLGVFLNVGAKMVGGSVLVIIFGVAVFLAGKRLKQL